MPDQDKMNELLEQLKLLVEKLDKPRRDWQSWATLLTSFLATVVLAGISLFFSNKESERNYRYNMQQMDLQKSNLRVEELKALNELIPSLASNDTNVRNVAYRLLEAANHSDRMNNDTGNSNHPATKQAADSPQQTDNIQPTSLTSSRGTPSLMADFYNLLQVARSSAEPNDRRNEALVKIQQVLHSENATDEIRRKGLDVVAEIASAPSTPSSVRTKASQVLSSIKNVSLQEIPSVLLHEKITRSVNAIILHHAGFPFSATRYQGAQSIFAIAKLQVEQKQWSKVSWHFAIAPDGTIWLGAPLREAAIHTRGQNANSVSILLMIDGDKEMPTAAMQASLQGLLPLLFTKLRLDASAVHTHHEFQNNKSCPGILITDGYIQTKLLPSGQ